MHHQDRRAARDFRAKIGKTGHISAEADDGAQFLRLPQAVIERERHALGVTDERDLAVIQAVFFADLSDILL